MSNPSNKQIIRYNGTNYESIKQMARVCNMPYSSIYASLKKGELYGKPIQAITPEPEKKAEPPVLKEAHKRGDPLMRWPVTCMISSNWRG